VGGGRVDTWRVALLLFLLWLNVPARGIRSAPSQSHRYRVECAMEADLMFVRGREAADAGNYDYAIAIFRDILRQSPDHVKSRIALRGCELEKFRERGGGFKAAFIGLLKGIGPYLRLLISTKSPEKQIEAAEQFLMNYPTFRPVLLRLAKALSKLRHYEAAINTLEFARQQSPENVSILVQLGETYAEKEDYRKAARCYEEAVRLRPRDRFLAERLKDLNAIAHLKSTGLEESKSYREQIRDEKKAIALEEEERLLHTTEEVAAAIARLQARLKEEPDNANIFIRLGDLYLRKEQYDFARACYEKAHALNPTFVTEEKLSDLEIRLLTIAEEKAIAAARATPDNADLQAQAREATRRRLDFAIRTYEDRAAKHPTEIPLRHQLGMYYFERGTAEDIAKAITCFQRAVVDPRFRENARFMLGRCFARDERTRDMAINQLEQALKLVLERAPLSDRAKEIQYNLAQVYEAMGDKSKALAWYKKVFEIDAAYRDVSRKVAQLA